MHFKKTYLLLFFTCLSYISFAQFGNEWINYDLTYYKFQIGEEGIYKVTYETLDSLGLPVTTLNPKNIQLYAKGEEVAIYVSGEADNSFDPGDFIEFYAIGNDGWLDKILYKNSHEQTNPNYSLYQDSLPYFLTWETSTTGIRMEQKTNTITSSKTDSFYLETKYFNYSSNFYLGIPNNNDPLSSYSTFVEGKGFHKWIWSHLSKTPIELPDFFANGPDTKIKFKAYSATHNTSAIINGFNHDFTISLNKTDNKVYSRKTLGHALINDSIFINSQDLSNIINLYIGDNTFSSSGINLTYIIAEYPRKYDLKNQDFKVLKTSVKNSLLKFSNCAWNKGLVYDLAKKTRSLVEIVADTLAFDLLSAGQSDIVLCNPSRVKLLTTDNFHSPLKFTSSNESNTSYLIISNKKLESGANSYKSYRSSSTGGNFNTELIFMQNIYNEFSFGIEHPLGLKRYIDKTRSENPTLQHILLLGKGQGLDRIRNNSTLRIEYNLVPMIGHPASDNLYVSDLDNTDLSIKTSIGRIPAKSNEQIASYLAKLRDFESLKGKTGQWRKSMIQLSGGSSLSEINQFKSYLTSYYNIAKDSFLGASRIVFAKDDDIPIQTSLEQEIQGEINTGSVVLNYFGHGAAQALELSIGSVSTLNQSSINSPLYIFNGCALGITYEQSSLCEEFLFAESKGPLGWIASTNFGYSNSLFAHTMEITKSLFQRKYGEGVGSALKDALDFYNYPSNILSTLQARQLNYLGDPALVVTPINKPDYTPIKVASNYDYSLEENQFVLELENLGKYTSDTLKVILQLSSSDGTLLLSKIHSVSGFASNKNIEFLVEKDLLENLVKINIIVDSDNSIEEYGILGETNNQLEEEIYFENNNVKILAPKLDDIITDNDLELKFDFGFNSTELKSLIFEIDTTKYFSSILLTSKITGKNSILSKKIKIPFYDKTDFYIRYKLENTSEWQSSSFALILGDSPGKSQGDFQKFTNFETSFLNTDTLSKKFLFANGQAVNYTIQCTGSDRGRYSHRRFYKNQEVLIWDWWPPNGVFIIPINPKTGDRYSEEYNTFNMTFVSTWGKTPSYGMKYFIDGQKCGIYNYNTNDSILQDSFVSFLNRIPEGYHILFMNSYNCDLTLLKENVWTALGAFGIEKLRRIDKGEPFAVFARKGLAIGNAIEHLPDYSNQVTPPTEQEIFKQQGLTEASSSGSFTSNIIGPVAKWHKLSLNFKDVTSNDSFSTNIYCSNDQSNWQKIITSNNKKIVDLESIDHSIYPYLKFKVSLFDDDDRSPITLKRWKINYQTLPDGIISLSNSQVISDSAIEQGEHIILQYNISNVSNTKLDSAYIVSYIRDENGDLDTFATKKREISENDIITITDTLNTKSLQGEVDFYSVYNFNKGVLESDYNNNTYFTKFQINSENKNPLLDITFDGRHLINNETISPSSNIEISLRDENEHLLLDDIKVLNFSIYKKTDNIFIELDSNKYGYLFLPSQNLKENTARIKIALINLEDGDYKIEANGVDKSGNKASIEDLSYLFKVINESSVSNIYPYPNPFTTQTQFVFSLTGQNIPDYFIINIFNISGKLVKSINLGELENLHIGNNITKYSWDGSDNYGDKLANGLYLYNVKIAVDGKQILPQDSQSDKMFKQQLGKIYILR